MTNEEYKSVRLTLGLTQQELGDLLGMDQRSIPRIENGPRVPTRKDAAAMRILFAVHELGFLPQLIELLAEQRPHLAPAVPQKPPTGKVARRTNITGIKRLSLGHTKNAAEQELLRYSITIPPKGGQERKTKTFYFGENRGQKEAFLDAVAFLREHGEYIGTDQDALEIYREFKHHLIK